MSNTDLWEKHRTPPEDALKKFKKRGGFAGTSIDPMWLILEATKEWGPIGGYWGYDVVSESIERFNEEWVLHTCNIELWYGGTGKGTGAAVGRVPSTGNTWLVAPGKYGPQYDDEASKKSRTDAITKALSWLGFAADVYMGMFDGNKYADLFDDAPVTTESSDNNAVQSPNPTESVGSEEWTSSIPDDILEVVKENFGMIKKRWDDGSTWHRRTMINFLGIGIKEEESIVGVIKSLGREQLAELAVLQTDKLKLREDE